MRKTIVIATAACMLTVTAAMANHQNQNADFNVNPTSFRTVELNTLCKAIVKGDVDLVKKLIAMGEDVNRKSLGKTPAIFAARYNRVEILKILIENGADLRIKSNKGHSITEIAELANAKEALQVINAEMQS
ncbi:ankyrin repeat domain-containing protein [Maribacter luteus]|uniref:Ankyrin repeat domain-containing protein n=1 Tax=Maribacter luteus TaxID=2594478 RepID=A0A6I2MS38_9FLAO|nr:ankyrin repeat domain-containing protein [Maribacter luteus]MRX65722.1 ankyrin repeat domain-containing protein [Maribacter luteus]|tara:strand:- start:60 stop:455 length:396 start_codon:yes stop_codon:yes gene_type:complete